MKTHFKIKVKFDGLKYVTNPSWLYLNETQNRNTVCFLIETTATPGAGKSGWPGTPRLAVD